MLLLAEVVLERRLDRVRLRDLLRLQPLPLEHVHEVGVAAEVELVGAVELDAALAEERRQDAVRDRRADLRLDVVADDRQAGVLEPLLPVGLARDEDGMQFTIAQPASRICSAYHFVAASEPTGRKLTTTSVPVSRRIPTTSSVSPGAFSTISLTYLPSPSCVIPRETRIPVFGHVRELDGVVRVRPDRVREVLADLVLRDVEGGGELDVADVVAAEVDVHEAGDEVVGRRVLVVLDALDERAGAVADPDDRDADLAVVAAGVAVGRCHLFPFCSSLRACPRGCERSGRSSWCRASGLRRSSGS